MEEERSLATSSLGVDEAVAGSAGVDPRESEGVDRCWRCWCRRLRAAPRNVSLGPAGPTIVHKYVHRNGVLVRCKTPTGGQRE